MPTTTPFGLRRTIALDAEFSEYVIESVGLINELLVATGRAFIFDTVDVRQQVIDGKHLWDMYGWVGRSDMAEQALCSWDSGDDSLLDSLDYVSITWLDDNGAPRMDIDAFITDG